MQPMLLSTCCCCWLASMLLPHIQQHTTSTCNSNTYTSADNTENTCFADM
jgi:hypothetical protein